MAEPAVDDEQPTELRNLFVKEVSLVGKAANRRRFLLYKSDTGEGDKPMPELTEKEAEELENLLNAPHPKEVDIIKALEADIGKALDASARNKVTAALRLLNGIDDVAVKAVVKTLSGLGAPDDVAAKKAAEEAKAKAEAAKKESEKVTATKTDEKLTALPPEIIELAKAGNYEAIAKAAADQPGMAVLVVELLKRQDADLKSRDGEIADLKKWQVEQIQKADDAEVRSIVTEAGLPGASIEDQCKLVKSMTAESRKTWAAHATGLRANIALGDQEKGTSRRGPDSYNPLEEINKRTAEMLAKSTDKKLTEGEAMLKVLEADPKLARDYRAFVKGETV